MIRIYIENPLAEKIVPHVDGARVAKDPKYGEGVDIIAYNREDMERKIAAYDMANAKAIEALHHEIALKNSRTS